MTPPFAGTCLHPQTLSRSAAPGCVSAAWLGPESWDAL